MAAQVLEEQGNAAEGARGQRGIGSLGAGALEEGHHHRVDLGVHALDALDGGFHEFFGRALAPRNELGLGAGVEFCEVRGHRGAPAV